MTSARRQWWCPTHNNHGYGLAIVWNNDYKGGFGFGIRTMHGQGEIISLNQDDARELHRMIGAHLARVDNVEYEK